MWETFKRMQTHANRHSAKDFAEKTLQMDVRSDALSTLDFEQHRFAISADEEIAGGARCDLSGRKKELLNSLRIDAGYVPAPPKLRKHR
jgi:hypothetical protein